MASAAFPTLWGRSQQVECVPKDPVNIPSDGKVNTAKGKICKWVCTERGEEGDCSNWEWQCKKMDKSQSASWFASLWKKQSNLTNYDRHIVYNASN